MKFYYIANYAYIHCILKLMKEVIHVSKLMKTVMTLLKMSKVYIHIHTCTCSKYNLNIYINFMYFTGGLEKKFMSIDQDKGTDS